MKFLPRYVLTLHVQCSLLRDMRCSSTGLRRTKEGDLSDEVCYHQLLGTHGHACMLRLLCCDETLCCYLLHAVHTPCTNDFLRWRPGRRHRSFISIVSSCEFPHVFITSHYYLRTQPLEQLAHCKCKTSRS
jgi:hypothetical protein